MSEDDSGEPLTDSGIASYVDVQRGHEDEIPGFL